MTNLIFNYANHPELKDVFASWEVGKSYKVTIDATLLSSSDEKGEMSINEIEVPSGSAINSKSLEPTEAEPMLIIVDPKVEALPHALRGY